MTMKTRFGVAAGVLSLAIGTQANAQAATADPGATSAAPNSMTAPTSDAVADAAKSGTADRGIQDIIVTANRREERLQDVPISVTAVTGAAVQARGVLTTASLPALAPSLNVTQNGLAANFFLRGVGLYGGNANNESSVALYVDGVYYASAQGNLFDLANVDRIEVLKGPQGTLFGRNATAGVIQIITRTPSHTPTFEASGGYSSYDTFFGSAYASAGLTDSLAADINVQGSHQNHGWGRDLTTGEPTFRQWNYSIRSKLLWDATDRLKLTLAGDYSRSRSPGVAAQPVKGASTIIGEPYPGKFNTYGDTDDYGKVKDRGASLHVDYDGGPVHLTSITAVRKDHNFFLLDQDDSAAKIVEANINAYQREITQEFQASNGPGSPITWLLGAYYFNYHTSFPLDIRGAQNIDIRPGQNSESFAVFGQVKVPLTSTTNLTVGGRYTTEDQRYVGAFNLPGTNIAVIGPVHEHQSFEKPTWRLTLDQKITPDILAYLSYNRGFKSGGYSLVVPPGAIPPFKPEKLDAFEAGLKTTLLDRRLQVNLSGFYYDYSNIQIQVTNPGVAYLINGPKATIYGGEIEAQARVTSALTVFGNASYLHARYGSFPNATREDRIPADGITPPECTGAGMPAVPGTNCSVPGYNASGNRLIYAPDWTYTVGGDYRIPTSVGTFNLNVSVYYNDGSYVAPDNRQRNPKYYLVNGSIGWTSSDQRFGVQAFGRNLANAYYNRLAVEQGPPFGDTRSGAEPRVFGVRASVKY